MKKIGRVILIEIKKAFCNKKFLLGTAILLTFSLLSAVYMIQSWAGYNPEQVLETWAQNGECTRNPDLPLFGFYKAWVGGDGLSLAALLFYTLLPVATALPFGWSYYVERKNGYLKNVYSRIDRKIYLVGKTIAVFLSGTAVAGICLVVNILLVLAKIPLITPSAWYNLYNQVKFGTLWADLYYSIPGLYVLLYMLLTAFYGGVFALLSFAAGCWFHNIFAVLFSPFLLMMIAGYLETVIQSRMGDRILIEVVPTRFLHPESAHYLITSWAAALVTAGLIAVSLLTIYFRGVRNETL